MAILGLGVSKVDIDSLSMSDVQNTIRLRRKSGSDLNGHC